MNGAKYIGLHLKLVLVELDVVSVLFARHSLRLFQRLSFHPVLTPAVKFHSCSSQVNCDFMHTGVRFCRLEINWCERSAHWFLGWWLMSTLVMSRARCRGSKAGLGRSDVRPCQTDHFNQWSSMIISEDDEDGEDEDDDDDNLLPGGADDLDGGLAFYQTL